MKPKPKPGRDKMNAAAIAAKIGNVIEMVEINGVVYTLAADAVVRVNDADEGEYIHCVRCTSMAQAAAIYAETIATAAKAAA
jgi:DNA-directed RNA polymerase subunit H (RpoH/RPB5)